MSLFHPHRFRPVAEVPQDKPEMLGVIGRNIITMVEVRREAEQSKSVQDKAADALTLFSGSMIFVYIHLVWFGLWVMINVGWSGIKPFDPFPFGLLTLIVFARSDLSIYLCAHQPESRWRSSRQARGS